MEDKCYFDRGHRCAILIGEKICDGCKFYKTKKQFEFAKDRAEKSLIEKGYVRRYHNGVVSAKRLVQPREVLHRSDDE